VAARIADGFPGGVWMVKLAALSRPETVAAAVAGALGLHDGDLGEALSGTEALIVLDNCEHVAQAAARLVEDVLCRCPRLRFLVTSREPLAIPGETLCPVEPLPAPSSERDDAAVLFAERAGAVRPGFEVTAENLGTVAAVCRRLDGLPLAIELAAARMRTLPLAELAARIDDRLALLTGGRTAPPRHRTLRAVVEWSWELLDEREQRVARRAAIFPSAFTLPAAEAICGPADDLLTVLSDCSGP
jgi:predicted ATPase